MQRRLLIGLPIATVRNVTARRTSVSPKLPRSAVKKPRDDRRAQLLEAARQVFADKGYDAATIDDITKVAGVAKGTFYLYFDEKREVLHGLVETFLSHLTAIGLSVAKQVSTPADYFDRVTHATTEILRVFSEHRALAKLAYRESMGIDRRLERMLRDFYRGIAEVEAENIRLGIKLGIFREVDPLVCAYAHIGMIERVALALYAEEPTVPPEALARQLLSIGYEGLRRR